MSEHRDKVTFDEVIRSLVATEVVADALPRKRAAYVATYVFTLGLIDENSRKVLTSDPPPFSASQLKNWDGIGATNAAINLLHERIWTPDVVIGELLTRCFARARNTGFIDSDEIPTLVGAAYAAGVLTIRQFPRTARLWIERRLAA